MKYTFNAKGKTEFAEPETWARSKNTVALVELVAKGVDTEKLTPKQLARVKRWKTLGFVTATGEEKVATTAKPKRISAKKAA